MNGFSQVSVQNFRRLVSAQIELRGLGVMIGANGIGKTTLLELFEILGSSARGELNTRVNAKGGIESLITYDKSDSVTFAIRMPVAGYPSIDYEIELLKSERAYVIRNETLSQKRFADQSPFLYINSSADNVRYYEKPESGPGKLVRPNWEHNPFEPSLSQVPKMFREPEDFRRRLAAIKSFGLMNVGPGSPVRQPQQMRPVQVLSETGDDLISSLYFLRETNHDRFEVLEDTLSAAFPDFERLDFPPVAAGMLTLTWKDKNFRHPIYLHQLSEGTLRFLWLASLLMSEKLPTVTLIDEPEVSLHPELLSLLADLLRAASGRTQLIVATHSDRLIRFLAPKEVMVFDRNPDGSTSVKWGDAQDLDIEKWLSDFTLDEVWRMGQLGGRA
ncbi:MAG: AAA family ATPase [Betaproteobacteria bacterium]|nr:AAA family ATPase [Betaproteobacteria bacterium]